MERRKVLITGAHGGLGTEVVRTLSPAFDLLPLGHDDIDVTSETSVRDVMARAGSVYGVVHLVGGWTGGRVAETSMHDWSKMLAMNVTSAFLTIREALTHLTKPGRIVAVSSIATLHPAAGSAAYTVAKSALNALVQTAAAEQRGTGITVNAVLPDSMATPAMLRSGADASKLVPPQRVAETIAWLLSDAAAGVTGTLIPIR